MNQSRLRLGELLVDARIITNEQLDTVLELQKIDRRRLGALLVEKGFLSETQLTQILSQQLAVPWVSLHHVDFSQRLLELIPADLATKYCLIPIYVRHVRAQGDTLYVAMDDPTNLEAIAECSERSGLPTRAMIASPSDIRKAVALYYNLSPNDVASTTTESDSHHNNIGAEQHDVESIDDITVSTAEITPIPNSEIESMPAADPSRTDSNVSTQKPFDVGTPDAPTVDSSHSVAETPSTPLEITDPTNSDTYDSDAGDSAPADPAANNPVSDEPASGDTASVADTSIDTGVQIEISEEMTLQELRNRRRAQGPDSSPPSSSPTSSERLMAMTLLDGTTIAVPVRPRPETLQRQALLNALVQPSEVTESDTSNARQPSDFDIVRDLLTAMQSGAPQPDETTANAAPVEPQAVLAATLKLLLAKGLITPHELLRALGRK